MKDPMSSESATILAKAMKDSSVKKLMIGYVFRNTCSLVLSYHPGVLILESNLVHNSRHFLVRFLYRVVIIHRFAYFMFSKMSCFVKY